MKKIIILLAISILITIRSFTQEYYQREELFLDANSWFFYEDYKEALPLFLKILEADSLNYNIMYKTGFCYLHIPGQKAKSISYLENAIKKTTPNYRNNTYTENLAPVDALFYLGNAYLVNNKIDEAIDAYTGFQSAIDRTKKFANKDLYNTDYINRQFDACRNAIQFQYKPVSFLAKNVGNPINTRFNEFNAVVSGDGSTLVFTTSLQFYDAIFYSKKENGKWTYPINLMGQLGIDDKSTTTGLSYDGTEMYIYRDDNFDGNIYVSYLKNGIWSKVKKLGENINTKYWEAHASISPDNNKLYFVSNREGGFGDLDIYVSERLTDTTWGIPANLSGSLNTRWNENTPFLTPDGKRLFFSSEGHQGMGGYDIFYSDLENGKWTEPVNIGYPINTTDNDIFFVPVEKGNFVYCSQFSKKGYGGQDLYQFHLFDLPGYNNFLVEGIVTLDNNVNRNRVDFKINIINKKNQDTVTVLNPNEGLLNYQHQTPLGNNHLVFESMLNEKIGQQFYISTPYNIKEIFLNTIDEEVTAQLAADNTFPDITLEKDSYDIKSNKKNLKVKLLLQKGNKLIVDTYYEGNLINTEDFEINKNDFIYEFKPLVGESKIKFNLIDKNNNVKTEEVTVSYLPKDSEAELSIDEKIVKIGADGNKIVKINSINNQEFQRILKSSELQNINSPDKLIDKLYAFTGSNQLSKEQVQIVNIALATNLTNNTSEFITGLLNLANGNLKIVLESILANKQNYSSNMEVIEELIVKSETHDFTINNIISLLEEYIRQSNIPVKELIAQMQEILEVDIANILTGFDASTLDITNIEELKQSLIQKEIYSKQELNQIFSLLSAALIVKSRDEKAKEFANLLEYCKWFNNKELHNIVSLSKINDTTSVEEFIHEIYAKAKSKGLSAKHVQALIITLAINSTDNTDKLIERLFELAEGDLKTVLESINTNKKDYRSNIDVIKELILKSETHNYTIQTIVSLLEKYIIQSDIPVKELISHIQEILKIDFAGIVTNIDAPVNSITNPDELKQYLTEQQIYSAKELDQILSLLDAMLIVKLKDSEVKEFFSFLEDAKLFRNQELSNILRSPEVIKAVTAAELVNNIYAQAKSQELTKKHTQVLIIALAMNSSENTSDFIERLYELAEGDLKSVLETILANKKNYVSNAEVIKELRLQSENQDFTVHNIISLLEEYVKQSNIPVENLIALLQQILEINFAGILSCIDISTLNITNIEQLKHYLKEQNIYTEDKINQLVNILEAIILTNTTDDLSTRVFQEKKFEEFFKMFTLAVMSLIILSLLIIFVRCRRIK